MADEIFGDRRKALEDSFFAKQNEKAKAALRAKQEGAAQREAMAAASGIRDDAVIDKLISLGMSAETFAALSLIPVVEVAWADGKLEAKERAAIIAGVEKQGVTPESPAHALLEGWLSTRPDAKLMAVWKDYAKALGGSLDADSKTRLRGDLVGRARAVAEAAGGFIGLGGKISKQEEDVLRELEQALS